MAKAKSSKANTVGKTNGSILLDEQVNRVQAILDHIEGCVRVLEPHLRERYDYDADSGTQAVLELIKERAEAASQIVGSSYGRLPKSVLDVRDGNIKRRDVAQ